MWNGLVKAMTRQKTKKIEWLYSTYEVPLK